MVPESYHYCIIQICRCFVGDRRVLLGTFLAPVAVVIIFYTIVLVITVCRLTIAAHKTVSQQANINTNTRATMLSFVAIYCIMILFGTTWFYGTLSMNPLSNNSQILFAVSNVIQSFCYFAFVVLFKEEGRNFWINLLNPKSCRRWFILTVASGHRSYLPSRTRRDDRIELSHIEKGDNDDTQVKSYSPAPMKSTVTESPDLGRLDHVGPGK